MDMVSKLKIAVFNFYYRFINAWVVWLWAIKNPYSLQEENFKMISGLYEMILLVYKEGNPRMTHIGFINIHGEKENIVSIWAGAGGDASPTRRIQELLLEINKLKENR